MANVPHAHYVMRNKARGWQIEPQVCRYNNITMSQYFRGLSDMARVCYVESFSLLICRIQMILQ